MSNNDKIDDNIIHTNKVFMYLQLLFHCTHIFHNKFISGMP